MKKLKLIVSACACTMLLSSNLYADVHGIGQSTTELRNSLHTKLSSTQAISIRRSGSFELELPPKEALPLFTAPGEKIWIPSWNPTILSGDGIETGTIFTTVHAGHKTYWNVVDYDEQSKHALYVRVTPESDSGTVDVTVKSNGKGGSIVHVSYQLTALTAVGSKNLQHNYSEFKYSQMMTKWKSMIESSL